MAYNASRARLSPPASAIHRPRKRGRSPPAPRAAVWCSSSENAASHDHGRRWQNHAGAPGRVSQHFRAPQSAVPLRRWVFAEEAWISGGDACTIISYNMLADNNAQNHRDLYLDVPWDAMRWDSRRRLIVREIRHWGSDLVCLQEVDRFREICAEMNNSGYESRFKRRTGDAKDGCATFWKSKRELNGPAPIIPLLLCFTSKLHSPKLIKYANF